METASLRIKFTPLLNNALRNGSKCCLEIVPEVSCVQNLDKISWKQEKGLIEYTIPMTYKITLKKRESLKEEEINDLVVDVPELDKTYHSCVDLLPPSSMTTFDFASGDVSRIISDTFILGKISAKYNEDKHPINNPINADELLLSDCLKELPKHMVHEQAVFVDDKRAEKENDAAIPKLVLSDSYQQRVVNKYSLDKITNTENTLVVCTETQSAETTTEISTRSRDDSKRKLSLSPICSIDTNDNPFRDVKDVPLNLVVDRIFQYETGDFNDNAPYTLLSRKEKHVHIKTLKDDSKDLVESFYKAHKRELPEVRVAKFIKKMETEIMPLKMMLNDILQKCSTLGLSKNKYIPRNLILYKSIPSSKNQVEKYCKTERQTKSNRVVYSIVFEGFQKMDNDSVVEQIVRSLSFEVEAIPQDNVIHLTTSTKSAPLNVKIRVRKKEEASFKHGVMSLPKPDRPDGIPERVRLVSSDQTIMSFNVVMEADFRKPVKKPRKNILGIFKPTMCLGTQPDEDEYAYLPSNSYTASINKESTSKSEGALTKFTLSRSVDGKETASTLPKRKKDIFGKCKPGGCLDPPFGEDKQAYIPANVDGQASKTGANVTKTDKTAKSTAERARTSSVFSNKLFNWKRKSSNDEALDDNVIKTKNRAESVLDLYQAGSVQAPTDYSNSIMTYPPTLNSSEHLRIHEEKQRGSRTFNDPPRNSFSAHSGSYFIMPRKPKNVLDKNNTAKIEDDSDIKVDTMHKNSDDQNVIAERLNFKVDATKPILRTAVTDDQGGTEENLMEPSESKTNQDLNREHFVDSSNPLLTEIGSKRITMQEDLSMPNFNFVPDSMIQNQKSVESNKLLTKEYSSEHNAEPTVEIEKTRIIVDEIKLLKAVYDHGNSTSLQEPNFETDMTIKNSLQIPIEDENKTGDKSVMTADAQNKKSNYDSTTAMEANSKTDLTLQTENRTLDKGLKDEGLMEIPTPIKRDTPLEFINVKDDDLQQVWKNMIANSLTSGTKLEPENEHTKQDKMVTAPNNEYTKQDTMTDEFKNVHTEQDTIIDESENQHIKQDTMTYEPKNEYIKQNNMINEPGNERTEQGNMINEPENERTKQDNMVTAPNNEYTKQDTMTDEFKNEHIEQDTIIDESENQHIKQDTMTYELKNVYIEQNNMINEPENERTEQDNMINEPENERTEQNNVINEPESEHTQLDNLINERENVYAKQDNMKDDLNNKTKILNQTSAKELFDQTEAQTVLSKDNLSKSIENEYKTETQYGNDKIQGRKEGVVSTTTVNDPLERKVGQNALFENKSPTLDKIDEIDSFASQNLEDISFITQKSKPSLLKTEYEDNSETTVIGEFVTNPVTEQPQINVKDIINFPQYVKTSETTTEWTQLEATFDMAPDKRKISDDYGANTQSEAYFNIAPDKGKISDEQSANIQSEAPFNIKEKISDDHGANLENDDINGFDQKTDKADAVNDDNKGETKHEQMKVNVDKITEKITDQKKPDEKHLLFNEEINEAKYNRQTDLQSEFNLNSKTDNQKTEKGSEIGFDRSFSNEQSKIQTQTSEIRLRHKARPVLFNLAIQSYVDDDKQVIIKSFDSNVAPQRYLHDSVRITRRYLNRDERIQIPIDSENELHVQIKSNAQADNSGREGNNMDQDITKKSAEEKYISEIDHVKRNAIIAEDIRRTLEAVYEKELLPLRNTISELKENMDMLTMQHMVLKGHMFIQKPRSSKLVPLFRKCGCMKK